MDVGGAATWKTDEAKHTNRKPINHSNATVNEKQSTTKTWYANSNPLPQIDKKISTRVSRITSSKVKWLCDSAMTENKKYVSKSYRYQWLLVKFHCLSCFSLGQFWQLGFHLFPPDMEYTSGFLIFHVTTIHLK